MALSKREKAVIDEIVRRQLQLESLIVGQISPVAGLGQRLFRADPFDSPLIISGEEQRKGSRRAAAAGKRAGKAKRRKVSAYQKEVGRQIKKLRKKHPKTPVTKLMKRAHRAAKKKRR